MAQQKREEHTQIRVTAKKAKDIPARYRASIVIVRGHAEGMEYPLEKHYTVIGRDKDTADIPINDPLISRQHAAISYDDDAFVLKDLESTNGTLVKGSEIKQVRIRHRDKFTIGDTTIQFILDETTAGAVYEIDDPDT